MSMLCKQEDEVSIEVLCQEKGYGAKKLIKEFPNRNQSVICEEVADED